MSKKIFILNVLLVVFGVIGFIDATYLTASHYKGVVPTCELHGCELVLTSHQNKIIGIPVALLGMMYYLSIIALGATSLAHKNTKYLQLASKITFVGFGASLYFVYLQLFVIKAICQYCMLSAGTSTLLFIIGLLILKKTKKEE